MTDDPETMPTSPPEPAAPVDPMARYEKAGYTEPIREATLGDMAAIEELLKSYKQFKKDREDRENGKALKGQAAPPKTVAGIDVVARLREKEEAALDALNQILTQVEPKEFHGYDLELRIRCLRTNTRYVRDRVSAENRSNTDEVQRAAAQDRQQRDEKDRAARDLRFARARTEQERQAKRKQEQQAEEDYRRANMVRPEAQPPKHAVTTMPSFKPEDLK